MLTRLDYARENYAVTVARHREVDKHERLQQVVEWRAVEAQQTFSE